MYGLYFDGKSLTYREDLEKPYKKGEALIKILYAGICNTDKEILKGYHNFKGIPGHEFVGIVEDASSKELVGKRIVGEINVGCGKCAYCLSGLERHCPNRTVLGILGRDGVFAEYTTLPEKNLYVLPDEIEDIEAPFIEPLASAFEIPEMVHIEPNEEVIIFGDGKLGLLISQVMRYYAKRVILVGKHREKLALAKKWGINTYHLDEVDKLKRARYVIEATGTQLGFDYATRYVVPRGYLILKSTTAQGASLNLSPVVVDEIRVIGTRCGPFTPAITALAEKRVNVKDMVTAIYPLKEYKEAFSRNDKRNSIKIIFEI